MSKTDEMDWILDTSKWNSDGFVKHDKNKINPAEVLFNAARLGVDSSNQMNVMLVPDGFIAEVVKVLKFGAEKYGANNWKRCNAREALERYSNASIRHALEIYEGKLVDDESNLLHAAHMACNAAFLIYFSNEIISANRMEARAEG